MKKPEVVQATALVDVPTGKAADAATVARVERLVRAGDAKALAALGPGLVEALEPLALDRHQLLPESIYRDVLPRCSPGFAALDRLGSTDVLERRRAADELAALAQRQRLGRLAVERLSTQVSGEADALVWQSVLTAVAGESGESAARLAYVALGHASAEVRRRGCEHLAAHPAAGHVRNLTPLLLDAHRGVVLAAIRALRAADRLDDLGPLQKLLASSDEEVQVEAAAALVRFHDPAGEAALERLAYSNDPQTRARAAVAMGELGQASFLPTLVRLLDDRRATVSHAAMASLPRVAGRDVAQSAGGTTEQIARWKRWFADGKRPER